MNPSKVVRQRVKRLTDLPNVGQATAKDLALLGIASPSDLIGQDPLRMYRALCAMTGVRHDPCVVDVFMSIVDFVGGEAPRPWWHYTALRKQRYGEV